MPTEPVDNKAVVVVMVGAEVVIDSACAGEIPPALSCTVTKKLNVPLADGLPEMIPLEELSVSPGVRVPAPTLQLE